MGKIKAEDIHFGKTDNVKGYHPTDVLIPKKYTLKECGEIHITILPGKNKPFSLEGLYYMTSKKYRYFNLKKIKDWDKVKKVVFNRFYRSGTDKRLRMGSLFLEVRLEKKGPRVVNKKN